MWGTGGGPMRSCTPTGFTGLVAGTALIEWLQRFRTPWLDAFFIGVTTLGDAAFYVLALAIIYLLVDRRKGYVLATIAVGSALLNDGLKAFFNEPRPPEELHVVEEDGLGFPSGHAQASTVFWGTLARMYPRWRTWLVAGAFIVLVSLSRVYLGVHTLRQVTAGVLVGLAVVWVAWGLESVVEDPLREMALGWKLALGFLVPTLALATFPRPDSWMFAGALTGLSWAYAWETSTDRDLITGWRVLVAGLAGFGLVLAPLLLLPEALPVLWLQGALPALALGTAGPLVGAWWRSREVVAS